MSNTTTRPPLNDLQIRHPLTHRCLSATAIVLGVLGAAAGPAHAHHGRDFLLARTAAIPHPGEGWLISRQDYLEDEDGELELEPAALFGVTNWLALEVHGHAAKESGGSLEYESTAPALHLRFARPHSPWALGLSAEVAVSHRSEVPDAAEASLALSGRVRRALLAVNLIAEEVQEEGADVAWGAAAGLRLPITDRLHWGIEVRASLEDDEEEGHEEEEHDSEALGRLTSKHGGEEHGDGEAHGHATGDEALLGLYFEASERLSINLGIGTGFDGGPDVTVRTGVIWRFR